MKRKFTHKLNVGHIHVKIISSKQLQCFDNIIEIFQMWINDLLIHVFSQRGTLSSGRVLGGSGSINYMHHIRGSRHDFDAWEKEGATGWSYKDVLPYFIKSEDVQIPELKDSRKKKIVS